MDLRQRRSWNVVDAEAESVYITLLGDIAEVKEKLHMLRKSNVLPWQRARSTVRDVLSHPPGSFA
jgi:hypothetical protein